MQDKKLNIWVIASVVRRISKLQCAVSAPLTVIIWDCKNNDYHVSLIIHPHNEIAAHDR